MSAFDEPIVVTGVGCHTPVGTTAPQTCAALAAQLSRLRSWQGFAVDGDRVRCGVIDPRDAPWVAKVGKFAEPALAEALWGAAVYGHPYNARWRLGLFLALPPVDRVDINDAGYGRCIRGLRRTWQRFTGHREFAVHLVEQVGGAVAIVEAIGALTRGDIDIAVVGGLESQVSAEHLDAMWRARRLPVAGRPTGLIPGEAAAFVVLEGREHARRRGVGVRARLASIALEREDDAWSPSSPASAAALSRAISVVLREPAAVRRVILDHTGERWRFRDWTLAEVRCLGELRRDWRIWHPTDCIGDPGAAFVPLAVTIAAHAFTGNYADGGQVLIAASAQTGERTALVVAPPEEA